MPASKAPVAALHDIPSTVQFTLTDGTRLTAAVRISPRARRARLSLSPRGDLVLAIPLGMGPQQLKASLQIFVPWLERAKNNQLRKLPTPQLPARVDLPLAGENYMVVAGGDMAAGRKVATASPATGTLQLTRGARRVLLVESANQLSLFGSVDDLSLCAQALRQWGRKKAALMLPPFLAHMAVSGGFALAGVSVRDQRARWGSCSRQRLQKHPAQTTQWPGGHRTKVLHQISARIRNLFSAQLPLGMGWREDADLEAQGPGPAPNGPEGRISLNWRALLLPVPLLEHLCWHELCHLRHMNHSAAYRAELARFSPRWPEQEKALNAAWRGLPWWALPGDDASGQG